MAASSLTLTRTEGLNYEFQPCTSAAVLIILRSLSLRSFSPSQRSLSLALSLSGNRFKQLGDVTPPSYVPQAHSGKASIITHSDNKTYLSLHKAIEQRERERMLLLPPLCRFYCVSSWKLMHLQIF